MEHKEVEEELFQITARYLEQVQAGEEPSLEDLLMRYPAHRVELLDFLAYYHLIEHGLPSPGSIPEEEEISFATRQALSTALERIEPVQKLQRKGGKPHLSRVAEHSPDYPE